MIVYVTPPPTQYACPLCRPQVFPVLTVCIILLAAGMCVCVIGCCLTDCMPSARDVCLCAPRCPSPCETCVYVCMYKCMYACMYDWLCNNIIPLGGLSAPNKSNWHATCQDTCNAACQMQGINAKGYEKRAHHAYPTCAGLSRRDAPARSPRSNA